MKKEKKIKVSKPKLLKNELFFKKGGYSIAITAIVVAAIIVFNVLVSALSDRFVLEFDMTPDKTNSISEENIEYIKSVDEDVSVIICSSEDSYSTYVGSVAQQSYGVTYDATANEYFLQTVKLINRYNDYNSKIKVKFMDTQSSEFTAVASEYANSNLQYGDVIVSTEKNGNKRYKVLNFDDIYKIEQDESYADYGMTMGSITGNNIETALTSAVAYVLSDIDTTVALLTGHSSTDLTEDYKTMLETNNYKVETVTSEVITKIDDDVDVIVVPAPTKDFVAEEITIISEFLDNNGKKGKGMIVFADANAPYLTNFYSYLSEWGFEIEEGIVYETDESNHITDDPTTLGSYNTGGDKDLSDMQMCITGYNVPLTLGFDKEGGMTATSIIATPESTVVAPKDATANWSGAEDAEQNAYSTVAETVSKEYDDDNNLLQSRVAVFSSAYFLGSDFNETASVSNKELTLALTERAAGTTGSGISFVAKEITNESFYESATEEASNIVRTVFMYILPIVVIALGIVIFVKRRNA